MKYKINEQEPDRVATIKLGLRDNVVNHGKPYCPCAIEKTDDTVCPCKEFRENTEMKKCHCGLYIREDQDDTNR